MEYLVPICLVLGNLIDTHKVKVIFGFHNLRFHEKPSVNCYLVNNGTRDSYWGGKIQSTKC